MSRAADRNEFNQAAVEKNMRMGASAEASVRHPKERETIFDTSISNSDFKGTTCEVCNFSLFVQLVICHRTQKDLKSFAQNG
jgi:hypothetical protein